MRGKIFFGVISLVSISSARWGARLSRRARAHALTSDPTGARFIGITFGHLKIAKLACHVADRSWHPDGAAIAGRRQWPKSSLRAIPVRW